MPSEIKPSKLRVLFVGAFQAPAGSNLKGGQLYACRSILESPLSDEVEWLKVDSTMESVPPPPLWRRVGPSFSRMLRFFGLLLFRRIDTVMIFTSSGIGFYEKGFLAMIARLVGKHVVFCPRSGFIIDDYRRNWLTRLIIPLVLRCCSVVVCQGQRWKEFFTSVTGLQPERFVIIGNCIRAASYSHVPPIGARSAPKVLLMGWIERNKGVFDLISVVDRFRQELLGVRFIICGRGIESDRLKEMIADCGLGSFFELRGWVEEREKLQALDEADIFLMLSYREGLPNALLEGMASGRAVVATAVGAVSEVVEDGVTGFLCEPGDIEEIGTRIVDLCQNLELRKRLGDAAKRRIMERHDTGTIWLRWKAVLNVNTASSADR